MSEIGEEVEVKLMIIEITRNM